MTATRDRAVATLWRRFACCAAARAATLAGPLTAGRRRRTLRDGVFTSDQALRGKSGYDGVCAAVPRRAADGQPGQRRRRSRGPAFLAHWDKDTLGSLCTKIRDTMPLKASPAR